MEGIRVLGRRPPLGATLVLIVETHEGVVIEEVELVFQTEAQRERCVWLAALAAAAFPGDGIARRHDGIDFGCRELRITDVARLGVSRRQFRRERVGERDFSLNVDALCHRRAEIGDEGNLTNRRHHGLLNVVPPDVVDAARNLDPVVDVVLRADLEAVDRVRIEGGRRLADAEGGEVARARGLRHGIVGAAGPKPLGVACVIQVPRVHLIREAHLGRERILRLRYGQRLRRQEQLRAAGQRVIRELQVRVARSGGELVLVGERIRALAEPGDLLIERLGLQEIRIVRKARVVQNRYAGAGSAVLEKIVVGEPGGGDRQLIQRGVVDLFQIRLAIVGEENAGSPDERRGRVVRLQPDLFGDVLLPIVDGSGRAVVRGADGQMQAGPVQQRIRRGCRAGGPIGVVVEKYAGLVKTEVVQGAVIAGFLLAVEIGRVRDQFGEAQIPFDLDCRQLEPVRIGAPRRVCIDELIML